MLCRSMYCGGFSNHRLSSIITHDRHHLHIATPIAISITISITITITIAIAIAITTTITLQGLPKWIESAFLSDNMSPNSVLFNPNKVTPKLWIQLKPFQKSGVEFVVKKNGRALIGDQMGLGMYSADGVDMEMEMGMGMEMEMGIGMEMIGMGKHVILTICLCQARQSRPSQWRRIIGQIGL